MPAEADGSRVSGFAGREGFVSLAGRGCSCRAAAGCGFGRTGNDL